MTQSLNKQRFIGREHEKLSLENLKRRNQASLITVYGRRRVGKTTLIEQVFHNRNLLNFEGIHRLPEKEQMQNVLWQLSEYTGKRYIAKLNAATWREIFKTIIEEVELEEWTLYFEEVQWLANYQDSFIADLKYVWDNFFKKNNQLIVILCGSSPSFMINHVVKSQALYNRSQLEMPLKELKLTEVKALLNGKVEREVMDAYLMVGGIPEYINWLKQYSSVFSSFCNQAFRPGGLFLNEYEKIFISSFSDKAHYREIIEYLAKNKFSTRQKILKYLKLKSSGTISEILNDLEVCGFIEKYAPYNLKEDSRIARYCISDGYLQLYNKFIKPEKSAIEKGDYVDSPASAINYDTLQKWLGYSFERFCRRNHKLIARILGFSGVKYKSGAYYNKGTNSLEPGYQVDLIFDRADHVITLCETKYLNKKIGVNVISEMESKIEKIDLKKNKTIQKVLICSEGAEDSLIARHYFDRIICLKDIFNPASSF